jgi:guanylate kinase
VTNPNSNQSAARGRLYVIAAPSGAGKTSLVKALLERRPGLRLSVSHTTRKPRPTEVEGREYFFVSVDEFKALAAGQEFLEHAQVFDNHYGTGASPVEAHLARGRSVILEIDWQGARQVRARLPACVTIFILPPSRDALERRLRNRKTESDAAIARRLSDAVGDMSHWKEFDFVVVNDNFERALAELERIVDFQDPELRADRPALLPLLAELLAQDPRIGL